MSVLCACQVLSYPHKSLSFFCPPPPPLGTADCWVSLWAGRQVEHGIKGANFSGKQNPRCCMCRLILYSRISGHPFDPDSNSRKARRWLKRESESGEGKGKKVGEQRIEKKEKENWKEGRVWWSTVFETKVCLEYIYKNAYQPWISRLVRGTDSPSDLTLTLSRSCFASSTNSSFMALNFLVVERREGKWVMCDCKDARVWEWGG
jgi:hypothetical protein